MTKTKTIVWLFCCILVLLIPLKNIHNGEAHILFASLMIILSFPLGYLLMTVVGLMTFALNKYMGVPTPSNEIMLIPLWLLFVFTGYYQWFVLTPKLWKKFRGKNET